MVLAYSQISPQLPLHVDTNNIKDYDIDDKEIIWNVQGGISTIVQKGTFKWTHMTKLYG